MASRGVTYERHRHLLQKPLQGSETTPILSRKKRAWAREGADAYRDLATDKGPIGEVEPIAATSSVIGGRSPRAGVFSNITTLVTFAFSWVLSSELWLLSLVPNY